MASRGGVALSCILAVIVGAFTITHPPLTIEGVAGDVSKLSIAIALITGGIVGVITIARGIFWVERYALGLIAAALGFHLIITIIAWTADNNRQLTVFALLLAIAFIIMRSFWIFRSRYRQITGKHLHR